MLADLAPGQPLVSFGRRSEHLPPAAAARFRDAIVDEARRRGLERVRAAPPPLEAPAPRAAPARAEGAAWSANVVTAVERTPPPRPAPPADVTWLEITSLDLDQATLAEGPGATHLLLDVTARRTDGARRSGAPPAEVEVRLLLVDPEPLAALDDPPPGGMGDAAPRVDEATARLLDRAAGRLASLLVPAPTAAVAPAPPSAAPGADGRAPPLEVTYAARHLGFTTARAERGQAVARDAGRAADALASGGVVCGPFAPVCAGALALVGAGAVGAAGVIGLAAAPADGPTSARLPPAAERAALLREVRRQAEALSLAHAVERAVREAAAAAGPGGPLLRATRVEVRLVGDEGAGFPARVALLVTVAPEDGRGAPDVLPLQTPTALPVLAWLDDDGALLRLALARAARAAGAAAVAHLGQAAPGRAAPAAPAR